MIAPNTNWIYIEFPIDQLVKLLATDSNNNKNGDNKTPTLVTALIFTIIDPMWINVKLSNTAIAYVTPNVVNFIKKADKNVKVMEMNFIFKGLGGE